MVDHILFNSFVKLNIVYKTSPLSDHKIQIFDYNHLGNNKKFIKKTVVNKLDIEEIKNELNILDFNKIHYTDPNILYNDIFNTFKKMVVKLC